MVEPVNPGLSVLLLLSTDPDRTAAFYRDVIGIELQPEEHDGKHRHYAGTAGGLYFTIQYAGDIPGPTPDAVHDSLQLCFSVADLDAFLRHLEQHAVKPLHPPRAFEHTTFISLRDPDGRLIRVMTPWN